MRRPELLASGRTGELSLSLVMQLQENSNRNLFRASSGRLCLAIVLLALCVGVQAVGAKSSHYSPISTQSRYFSASVKIVKFIPLEVVALQIDVIPVVQFHLQEPKFEIAFPVVEFISARTDPPVPAVLPRSPPLNS